MKDKYYMKRKTILFINSEGLPFGFSASANKIRYIGEIFAQSQIDVYCLNKHIYTLKVLEVTGWKSLA